MSAQQQQPTVEEILNGIETTLLLCTVEDLQYELPSGKMAESMHVGRSEVVFTASEKFGDGMEPYAASPETHREYLQSEDAIGGEGSVRYDVGEDEPLRLPKVVYFEEAVSFEEQIQTDNLREAVDQVEAELDKIINNPIELDLPSEFAA